MSDYDALLSGLSEHFKPEGTLEDFLVQKLAVLILRYRRLIYSERAGMSPARIQWAFDLNSDFLDRIPRYEASIERSFDRTIMQLERIQRMRLGLPVAPALKVDISS